MFKLFSDIWAKFTEAWQRRSARQKRAKTAAKKTRKDVERIEYGRRIDLGRARNDALKNRRP